MSTDAHIEEWRRIAAPIKDRDAYEGYYIIAVPRDGTKTHYGGNYGHSAKTRAELERFLRRALSELTRLNKIYPATS